MNFNLGNNGMQNGMFNPVLGNWDPNFSHDELHQAGPMRRGGGRFNTRAGPYDRQPRDGRGGRFPGPSGRLTPPRGVRAGGQRFGDGGPGPTQATEGRSLKSYEDLDAVGSGGNGELNY